MATATQVPTGKSTRTKIALWILIAPTVMIFGSAILYALANMAFEEAGSGVAITAVNVALYILAVIGVLAWLPGLITGIVLLATKK